MTTLQSTVASEASPFSLALAARAPCPLGGHPGTVGRMLLFQEQRNKLPTSLPHSHVTSSLLFTAYSQPDWVKIKRLYLFPCGGCVTIMTRQQGGNLRRKDSGNL